MLIYDWISTVARLARNSWHHQLLSTLQSNFTGIKRHVASQRMGQGLPSAIWFLCFQSIKRYKGELCHEGEWHFDGSFSIFSRKESKYAPKGKDIRSVTATSNTLYNWTRKLHTFLLNTNHNVTNLIFIKKKS